MNIMNTDLRPNAILSSSDTITIRVLGVLSELGYKVPEDLAVIGYSNIDFPKSLNPSLSTIRQPATEIGRLSTEKLIEFIKKRNWLQYDPETIQLETELTFRKSTTVH
jgi:LacI family transcriptional regulator